VSAPVSFEMLEGGPVRLEASPARTHWVWSDAAKVRIVEESLAGMSPKFPPAPMDEMTR
jgi:hypothetical protein